MYLFALELTFRSDHQALKWFIQKKPDKSIKGQWLKELHCYCYRVENVKGAKNKSADGLSGRKDGSFIAAHASMYEDPDSPVDLLVVLSSISKEWAVVQLSDPKLLKHIRAFKANEMPEDDIRLVRHVVE